MSNGKQLFVILSSPPTRSPPISRLNFAPIKRVRTWRSRTSNLERCHALGIERKYIANRRFHHQQLGEHTRTRWIYLLNTWISYSRSRLKHACPPPLTTEKVIKNHVIENPSSHVRSLQLNLVLCINISPINLWLLLKSRKYVLNLLHKVSNIF